MSSHTTTDARVVYADGCAEVNLMTPEQAQRFADRMNLGDPSRPARVQTRTKTTTWSEWTEAPAPWIDGDVTQFVCDGFTTVRVRQDGVWARVYDSNTGSSLVAAGPGYTDAEMNNQLQSYGEWTVIRRNGKLVQR